MSQLALSVPIPAAALEFLGHRIEDLCDTIRTGPREVALAATRTINDELTEPPAQLHAPLELVAFRAQIAR